VARATLAGQRDGAEGEEVSNRATKPSAWVSHLAVRELGVEEALRELARSRAVAVKSKSERPSAVRPAYRTDGNAEFAEPPGDGLKWGIAALIAFALIDWFVVKLL
jgi:hypothetical protein